MMKYLQKLGKVLMLPVACLPICGILMGIGYALCPSTMQGGEVNGLVEIIGFFLVKAGGALIDNMHWLFVIGVAVGMTDDHDGTAGLAGLVSWLMITKLLNPGVVTTIMPSIADNANSMLAFGKIENAFIGIIAGLIGASCYNRFKNTRLPDALSFFSGKRSVAIITAVVSIAAAAILLFAWPLIFGGLVALGKGIVGMGAVGAGIYAFLNRLLIPTGLHHALNNVFWFDTIGLGDLSNFWAGKTSADVTWDLGMYMSGFFPCMMFGIPGAALAMIQTAKDNKKKIAVGLVASAAVLYLRCSRALRVWLYVPCSDSVRYLRSAVRYFHHHHCTPGLPGRLLLLRWFNRPGILCFPSGSTENLADSSSGRSSICSILPGIPLCYYCI